MFICSMYGFDACLTNLRFLAWHKIRVFSLMEITDTQSVLDKELDVDSGCFWLGESGSSVAELSCWKQHDCILEEGSCWWRCLHLLLHGSVAWKKPQTPLLPLLCSSHTLFSFMFVNICSFCNFCNFWSITLAWCWRSAIYNTGEPFLKEYLFVEEK